MDNSITDKSKPYFIELWTGPQQLKNKFKFMLKAVTVKELKMQIQDKLIAKKELEKDSEFSLKDKDDYELDSGDEVEDVVAENKVKVCLKGSQPMAPPPPPPAPVNSPAVSQQSIPSVANIAPPSVN